MNTFNETLSNLKFFPIILDIQFFKVPKKGGTKCNLGFGLCFTITITFRISEGSVTKPETSYNLETGEVKAWGSIDLDNPVSMNLCFPSNIVESPFHSEEDLMKFSVIEDKEYGDVTFLVGEYEKEENEDGFNYNVRINTI